MGRHDATGDGVLHWTAITPSGHLKIHVEEAVPIAFRHPLERFGMLAAGLALGALFAGQPVLASLQQPSTTPIAWMAPPGVV